MGRSVVSERVRVGIVWAVVATGPLGFGCFQRHRGGDDEPNHQPNTKADASVGEQPHGGGSAGRGSVAGTTVTSQAGRAGGEPDSGTPPTTVPPRDPGSPNPRPCDKDEPPGVDKVDLLFAIDNSGSMKEEQAALREQFPRLIRVLTTGDLGDGSPPFPPATDLHIGVVSSDLGLVGISDIDKCDGLGDDGILLNVPNPEITGCSVAYPRFLTYSAGLNDVTTTANDFACIAALGTEGCGFEQQLESVLKALWPSTDNRVTFLGDPMGFGRVGQGDGPNAGFLRNDATSGRSLIAVIMVTDEEDCSSLDTSHFTPMHFLDPADPLAMQDLNLRCYFNPGNLYPIERYVNGFRELRPENPALVLFAAVVGVPPETVSPERRASVDFSDPVSRDAFYSAILDHPAMQEQIDPFRTPQQGGNLVPSCNTDRGKAYPPRRIVETARRFGENGVVQSICEADFRPAVDAILSRIGDRLREPCVRIPD